MVAVLFTAGSICHAQSDRGDLGWLEIRDAHYEADLWRWQFPAWAYAQVRETTIEQDYDLRYAANPFMLHGDFDGDGLIDVAAWVERRNANQGSALEIGVVVVHRAGGVHFIPAAGPNWELYECCRVDQGVEEGPPPRLMGDALLFVKPQAASAIWYWDGSTYRYYHQGD